jgi:hypothetical protein
MKANRQNSTESTLEITVQQAEVIAALLGGSSVTEAMKKAHADRSTFYNWRKSATFQAELNRARQEQMEATRAQMWGLAGSAVATLREMLTGTDVPLAIRLKAALSVLAALGTLQPEPSKEIDPEKIESDLFIDRLGIFA